MIRVFKRPKKFFLIFYGKVFHESKKNFQFFWLEIFLGLPEHPYHKKFENFSRGAWKPYPWLQSES